MLDIYYTKITAHRQGKFLINRRFRGLRG